MTTGGGVTLDLPVLVPPVSLRTDRLLLRPWKPADRDPFALLNADPKVMAHFPAVLTQTESDALADRIETSMAIRGWGLWAVERLDTGAFIGFTGLAVPRFDVPFMPAVEIGWRLARTHWGHGFAPEAATEVLRLALDDLGLPQVVSFTTAGNANSRRVMEKIGLVHDPAGDFDHPDLPPGHRLGRHVLYRS